MKNVITPRVLEALAEVEESVGDVLDAKTMPKEVYADEEFYRFEQEAVFARSWLSLGRVDQVAKPGDFTRIDVDKEPLMIVRGNDNKVRVLSAVCAHRGCLVTEGSGNVGKLIRCPLHAWTYGLDGELLGAPGMEATGSVQDLRAQGMRLAELRTEEWNGFLFVNFDADAAPLRPTLGKLEGEFVNYRMDELVSMPTVDFPGCKWNWKGMLENGIEPYHTAYLHHTIHDWAHVRLASFAAWDDNDGAIYHPTGAYQPDGGFNATERAFFPPIQTLGEKERQQILFANVPPTMFMGAMPDYVFYYLIMPVSPDEMNLRIGMCYPKSTTELPMFERLHAATIQGIEMFVEQDNWADGLVQQGQHSRFRTRGRYSFQEETLVQQNRWLLKRYRDYINLTTGGRYDELMSDVRKAKRIERVFAGGAPAS
jgi:phenylpropionate dioxygenase-like ring-hydroxylating dioxygenase large terminal subunit